VSTTESLPLAYTRCSWMQTKDLNLGFSFLELEQYGRIVTTLKDRIEDMWK